MSLTPYPELDSAITDAAGQYGIDPSVLAGIWRIESGSSYPNPYINSIGYGGLFGIGQSQALANGFSLLDAGTTAQQAQIAAMDLANLVKQKGGDLAAALSAYSGGGYSSVGAGGSSTGGTGKGGTGSNPSTATATGALSDLLAQVKGLPAPVLVGGAIALGFLLLD